MVDPVGQSPGGHVALLGDSVGGNDLLLMSEVLSTQASSTTEALELFGARRREFEREYRHALEPVLALGRDVTPSARSARASSGPPG